MLSGVLRPLKRVLPASSAENKNLSGEGSSASAMAVDSVALMVSSGLNAVLGVFYWMAVTHLYPVAQVGRATTLINAGIVFSSASILAFGQMLERFLPVAGERRLRIVVGATLIVTTMSLLLSGAFVLLWPTDALLLNPWERAVYPLCVAILTIFALLDSVLVGVHCGRFAATKNVLHAVVKLIAVIVMGLWLTEGSAPVIVASWIVPAAVLIVVTQAWLYARGRTRAAGSVPDALPPRRDLIVYFLSTTGWIVGQVLPGLFIPLLVERTLGLAAAAYFNIAWIVVAASIMLMSVASGPFVASASRPDADLASQTRAFRKIVVLVSLFRLVAVSVAGPIALLLYGWDYAEQGTPLLILMGIAHAISGPALIYGALSKVYRQLYYPMTVQLVGAVLLVVLVWLWLPTYGIVAVGWAFIVHDIGVLLAAAIPLRRLYRRAMAGNRGAEDSVSKPEEAGESGAEAEGEQPVPSGAVLIWREQVLPGSETFIRNHVRGMRVFRGVLAGTMRVHSPVSAPEDIVIYGDGLIDRVCRLVAAKSGVSPRLMRQLWLAKRGAGRFSPDGVPVRLVHAHFVNDAWFIALSAKAVGLPLVVTCHGYDVTAKPAQKGIAGLVYRARTRCVFALADEVIAVSEFIACQARALGCSDPVIRYNGIEIDSQALITSSPADDNVQPEEAEQSDIDDVIFVGRLVAKKGVADLLQALSMVATSRGQVIARIIGDGHLRQSLEHLAHQLEHTVAQTGAQLTVHFDGAADPETVAQRLRSARVFVGPSTTASNGDCEGFGQVFLEAALAGLPCVSRVHGGIPEAVDNGVTGLLSEEGDNVALAAHICQLLADDAARERMGRAGQCRVREHFDVMTCLAKIEDDYRALLAR